MIAGDILPEQGDPSALAKLILGFRQAKQQEAATDLEMRLQQAKLQELQQLAPMVLQSRQQALQLGEQQMQMNQQQMEMNQQLAPMVLQGKKQDLQLGQKKIEMAAEELAELRRQSGVLPRFTNAMTKGLGVMKSVADLAKVTQETQLAAQRAADARIQQAESNRREFYKALADPETGEAMVQFVASNPGMAEGYGIRQDEVPQFIQQAMAFHAERKRRADHLARVQSYEANLIRALQVAVQGGDDEQIVATARALARSRTPPQDFEDPVAHEARVTAALQDILVAFGYQGGMKSGKPQSQSQQPAQRPASPPPPTVAPQVEAMQGRQQQRPVVRTRAEYDALPPGTEFIRASTGELRIKPMGGDGAQSGGR